MFLFVACSADHASKSIVVEGRKLKEKVKKYRSIASSYIMFSAFGDGAN